MAKTWFEPAIPLLLLVATVGYFVVMIPTFTTAGNVDSMLRQLAEFVILTFALGLTLMSGGIDLSVGAVFGLANFTALALLTIFGLPIPLVVLGTLGMGAVVGLVNGYLIAYLKARPFLTTLVMFLVLQAVLSRLVVERAAGLAQAAPESLGWDFLGMGTVAGLPSDIAVLLILLVVGHVVLSRSRPGRHLIAVGSSRRAARHAGIPVERVILATYVTSGLLGAMAGVFLAARLNSASAEISAGVIYSLLAAVVIGGVSLNGGVGTVWRMLIGGSLVFVLNNGLLQMNVSGNLYGFILAVVLLVAVGADRKWSKNRAKAIQKIYINPTMVEYGPLVDVSPSSDSPFAMNNRLTDAEGIAVGQVEGPEDVIVDRQGRLYSGDRRGWHLRFSGPGFTNREVFGRIGGFPLGLAFDKDENLLCCVGGMGLYSIAPDGTSTKLTDETNRTWYRLRDDSRLRLTDDLDIVPDGKVYFSEATERFEAHDWILDGLEGRPNGRVVCYDPATRKTRTVIKSLVFPNGICSTHDGESILIGLTWPCQLLRYWHSGSKAGKLEVFVDNLPGYVDNINRSADGTYWVALNGMRSPTFDLAFRMPGFRRRMMKEIPREEWLYPNMNFGFVLKVSEDGEVLESLWDPGGKAHATTTSIREFEGHLYLGGLDNNRIGRIKLPEPAVRCECGQPPCLARRDVERTTVPAADRQTAPGGPVRRR